MSSHLNWNFKDEIFCKGEKCNPLILDVRITVSVLDTAYKIDLTFLIVRLSWLKFQILFFNILGLSEFSEIFLDYFRKSPELVSTNTDNRLYAFFFAHRVEFLESIFTLYLRRYYLHSAIFGDFSEFIKNRAKLVSSSIGDMFQDF